MNDAGEVPAWTSMTAEQAQRWDQLLRGIAAAIAPGPRFVVVDGHRHVPVFVDRLAATLAAMGQDSARLSDQNPFLDQDAAQTNRQANIVALAYGRHWRIRPPPGRDWDVVIWLRTPPPTGTLRDVERDAHIVVDLHDPTWPVIRRIDESLADNRGWYLSEMQAFFAVRAATWDAKFGADLPAYVHAISQIGIRVGSTVLDVGCGTGRALLALRAVVGLSGHVVGIDYTAQMLAAARDSGRADHALLIRADALHLPLPDALADAVFAAGLIGHLPEVEAGLFELARVTADRGRLALFHPSGRAALAARHGRTLRPDEPLSEGPLHGALRRTGWHMDEYDDADHRFFALATRQPRQLNE
jgi:SAM-dependent methyltransferase